jgi:hypothetical protein
MIVQFFDREVESNPLNGMRIDENKKLLEFLDRLDERPAFCCELVGANGYKLLLGVGGPLGCAQFSHESGAPPYMMATTTGSKGRNEDVVFLIGGTPSPIPGRYCLPQVVIKEVAMHFQATGSMSPAVEWEEV